MASSSGSGGVSRRVFLKGQKQKLRDRLAELTQEEPIRAVRRAADERGEPPADLADQARASNDHEIAVTLVNGQGAEHEAILAALEKFEDGLYGLCESCEEAIPHVRLNAVPAARFCVPCQGRMETAAGQRPAKARR